MKWKKAKKYTKLTTIMIKIYSIYENKIYEKYFLFGKFFNGW